MAQKDRWLKRWVVPSDSGPGNHIVGQDAEGNYGCDCVGWTRHMPRRDCKHIQKVKDGDALTEAEFTLRLMRPQTTNKRNKGR